MIRVTLCVLSVFASSAPQAIFSALPVPGSLDNFGGSEIGPRLSDPQGARQGWRASKPGACRPWQARSAGCSLRYVVPTSLWHRPKPFFALAVLLRSKDRGVPSVARPFTGQRVHWTLCNAPVHPWLGRRQRKIPRRSSDRRGMVKIG